MAKPLLKRLVGEYNPDGTIKSDPGVSALSERETQPGDRVVRITGTPYFYRVLAGESRQLTPETRAELEAELRPKPAVKADAKPAPEKKEL